jgi:hypothetical protein
MKPSQTRRWSHRKPNCYDCRQKNRKQPCENRAILKPSWAFVETNMEIGILMYICGSVIVLMVIILRCQHHFSTNPYATSIVHLCVNNPVISKETLLNVNVGLNWIKDEKIQCPFWTFLLVWLSYYPYSSSFSYILVSTLSIKYFQFGSIFYLNVCLVKKIWANICAEDI